MGDDTHDVCICVLDGFEAKFNYLKSNAIITKVWDRLCVRVCARFRTAKKQWVWCFIVVVPAAAASAGAYFFGIDKWGGKPGNEIVMVW